MSKFILVFGVMVFLAGCSSTMTYRGAGSFDELVKARYDCSRVDGGVCNQSQFDACVASKGFYRAKNGRHDASSIMLSTRQCYNSHDNSHMNKALGKALRDWGKSISNPQMPTGGTTYRTGPDGDMFRCENGICVRD